MQSTVMDLRDRAARIVQDHYWPVRRYLRYLGCPEAQADDLAQETFVAFLNRPLVQSEPEALPSYLRSIARNLYLKTIRKSKSGPTCREIREADAVWDRYSCHEGWEAYREAVRGCLEGLEGRDRELLETYYGRKSGRGDVAAAFGLSEEGLKTQLRRLKERLKNCVRGRLSHE